MMVKNTLGEKRMKEKIVIALGGNALQSGKGEATAQAQLTVVRSTCEHIAQISEKGYEIAVVHGNGPQVGRIVMASEAAKNVTTAMPIDVCGAMSQGYIGYHIQQCLKYALNKTNRNIPVVTVATQVIVEETDPAFKNPTKPIGPFYSQEEARQLAAEKGYDLRQKHLDCGMLIFDSETQDTHAGGSGCGCAAVTLASYLMPKIESGEWKRILFVPTGALMSTVSLYEGASVPGTAHGIVIEHCRKEAAGWTI